MWGQRVIAALWSEVPGQPLAMMNESHHQHQQQVVNINSEVAGPKQPGGLKTIIYIVFLTIQ